jgi:hypothetical protein
MLEINNSHSVNGSSEGCGDINAMLPFQRPNIRATSSRLARPGASLSIVKSFVLSGISQLRSFTLQSFNCNLTCLHSC